MIHPTADVQTSNIGEETVVWQFCIILPNAVIGNNCNINCHVFIENDVVIGNDVTIKSGVQVWDGVILEDKVFVGPNVSFTNDLYPRSKDKYAPFVKTVIKKGASIGANATILAGITIGQYAMVGAGAVATRNISDFELWVGNPARHVGYVTKEAEVLDLNLISKRNGKAYKWESNLLVEKGVPEKNGKLLEMEQTIIITGNGIRMRLIEKKDAEFILDLRIDKKLGRFISSTSVDINKQVQWIEEYKEREAAQQEYYFIYEDADKKPWGTIRLYNFHEDSFTAGSWICWPGNTNNIAIRAWLLAIEYGFEKLNFTTCLLDVRKKNRPVLNYLKLYQPTLINENKLDYFFSLDKDNFYAHRQKVINFLQIVR